MTPRIGSLFSGYGGLDMAVEAFFGARTVWHCEFDEHPAKVLAAHWPGIPNLGDIAAVDWSQVESVDILVGGFPCTDVSLAGRRAGMIDGTRSGLWAEFREAIAQLRPSVVVIENVRGLFSAWGEPPHEGYAAAAAEADRWQRIVNLIDHKLTKHPEDGPYVARKQRERVRCARHHKQALARCQREDRLIPRAFPVVLAELSDLGFDAEWHSLRASDIGAPHARFRVFILAYAHGFRPERDWGPWGRGEGLADDGRVIADTGCVRLDQGRSSIAGETPGGWASTVPGRRAEPPVTLLPTPNAAVSNDGEGIDTWMRRRRDVKAATGANNGMPSEPTWGPYQAAVTQWEHLTRPAPSATLPDGRGGAHRLNAAFPEWMMGLPEAWVTGVLPRIPALKAIGNGVCPQQAYAALHVMWPRVIEAVAA